MTEIRLTVPMPMNLANGSHGHWGQRHRDKIAYWDKLDMLVYAKRIPPAPPQPFARTSISSTMHLGAAMDDSNAMRRHKWVEDWLTTRGYIKDDRKTALRWEGFPEQVITRGRCAERKIDLVLREL